MTALAELSAEGRELNLANVVGNAGIGRNTFYEYFDDVEHAVRLSKSRTLRALASTVELALNGMRTPLERVRALSRAWVANLLADPGSAQLALRAQPAEFDVAQLSVLGRYVATVLETDVDALSALPGLADRFRVTVVAALFDALSRAHFAEQPVAGEELQRALADLSLRLLR